MIKLDSIFKALGVETENDVRLLAQYFVSHNQYKDLIKNKTFVQQQHHQQQQQQPNDLLAGLEGADIRSDNVLPSDAVNLINQNEVVKALKTFVTFHHKTDR